MKKYLWIVLFFVTTLCFAQPNAEINQASTDNNLVIQLVDSKLVNFDNKIAAVAQNNKDGIADLKASTDVKLADKFKQLDDKGVYVGWWLNVLGIWLTIIGLLAPLGAFWLNHKINKNIKDSQELLDKEIKKAVDQVKNKLEEADRLINQIRENHKKSQELTEQQEQMLKNPPTEVTEQNQSDIEKINEVLAEKSENQLTAKDWFIKGLNAQDNGEYYEAITYYNKVIQLNKKEELNSSVYSNLGVAKFKLGLYHDAIKDYGLAIKLSDKNYHAYFNRALANRKLEDNDLALKDYDKAIELNPHRSDTYSNRGIVHFELEDYDKALLDFDKAIKLNPKNVRAYFNKACAYALMKNKPEALNWLEKAFQLAYSVDNVLKDEGWKIYLDDVDFKNLIAKYNK